MNKFLIAVPLFFVAACGAPFTTAEDVGTVTEQHDASSAAPSDAGKDATQAPVDAAPAPSDAAPASLDAAPAPDADAGCTLITHANGTGQAWQDCAPESTRSLKEATAACQAWCTANNCVSCWDGSCDGKEYIFGETTVTGGDIVGWSLVTGDVVHMNPETGMCAAAGAWQ